MIRNFADYFLTELPLWVCVYVNTNIKRGKYVCTVLDKSDIDATMFVLSLFGLVPALKLSCSIIE